MLSGVRLGDLTQAGRRDAQDLRERTWAEAWSSPRARRICAGLRLGRSRRSCPSRTPCPRREERPACASCTFLTTPEACAGSAAGATKIDVLKEAAAASVGQLAPQALVGVIAFNRDFERLIPIQPLGDGAALYERLRSLDAAGGTDIYYPLVDALDLLEGVEARVKHILLFSDGKTVDEYRDFPSLVERLRGGDVRLTAIAVGPSANLPLLNTLAEAGHGTVYPATDFAALPRISIEATQRLSRSRFTDAITPVRGPFATGDLAELPPCTATC